MVVIVAFVLACGPRDDFPPPCRLKRGERLQIDDTDSFGHSPMETLAALSSFEGAIRWTFYTDDGGRRNVSERVELRVVHAPGSQVYRSQLDLLWEGCDWLYDAGYEGSVMHLDDVLVDIQSLDSANHLGGSVQMVVLPEPSWDTVGFFFSEWDNISLYSASQDLLNSIDVVSWNQVYQGVSPEDVSVGGAIVQGSLALPTLSVVLNFPLPGRRGTGTASGALAEIDLGLDPDASIFP